MTASKIEWTGRSDWNPVRGCSRVTEACVNCYAEIMAARFSKPGMWGHGFAKMVTLPDSSVDHRWTGKVELQEDRLTIPLRWRKPSLVFPNSTSDFFHEKLSFSAIDRLHATMALTPHLTYQILTKRPARAREYYSDRATPDRVKVEMWKLSERRTDYLHGGWPLRNIWLGTSVHDQESANEFIPQLLNTPVALRFISAEPLLGPIDLMMLGKGGPKIIDALQGCIGTSVGDGEYDGAQPCAKLGWVITGGESGHHARPMHPDWARSLRDQCKDAGVPFFFKQWGEWLPWNHFRISGIEDGEPDQPTRFSTKQWIGDRWEDEGYPSWIDSSDGAIDDDQCVGRVGKDKSGAILDGVEHKNFPAALTV